MLDITDSALDASRNVN